MQAPSPQGYKPPRLLSAFTAGTNPRDSLAEAVLSALPGEHRSAHIMCLGFVGEEGSRIHLTALSVTGWGGGSSLFLYRSRAIPGDFGSSLCHEQSKGWCAFAIDHCQTVMPSRLANRLRGSNFMFLHKEHLDLTLASSARILLPFCSSISQNEILQHRHYPAKGSREALPQGRSLHGAVRGMRSPCSLSTATGTFTNCCHFHVGTLPAVNTVLWRGSHHLGL